MTEPGAVATRGRSSRVRWVVVVCGVMILVIVVSAWSSLWARHQLENGPDVDGVLWRQVASVEDPFTRSLHSPTVGTVTDLLDGLVGDPWDGSAEEADALDLSRLTLLIHDVEANARVVAFGVFVSSGERVASLEEGPRMPWRPSAHFTCYRVTVAFADSAPPSITGADVPECPGLLVSRMPSGATYKAPAAFAG